MILSLYIPNFNYLIYGWNKMYAGTTSQLCHKFIFRLLLPSNTDKVPNLFKN